MNNETEKQLAEWVAVDDFGVVGVFLDRKEAVKWFKELLKRTLKDFDKQDKIDEYDYPITINKLNIYPFKQRDTFLGLR
jgi:hypothetical protein